MKKLFLATLICLGMMPMVFAQETDREVSQEDYERMIQNEMEIEFRSLAINTLGLTESQIKDFDPIFREYMDDKSELMEKKLEMIEEYNEDSDEERDPDDIEDDRGDFIEDYWEVEIDEMKLKKAYFDKLEDKITAQKAFDFFLLEEMVQSRMQERRRTAWVPLIIQLDDESVARSTSNKMKSDDKYTDKSSDKMKSDKNYTHKSSDKMTDKGANNTAKATTVNKKYKSDIEAYDKWVIHHKGGVDLDHKYTHDGLTKLMAAITAISEARNIKIDNFDSNKQKVLNIADQLRKDPTSDKHADITREAFIMTSEMLSAINKKGNFENNSEPINELNNAAKKLDPAKLMTPQAQHIYNYFYKAQKVINNMSETISWAGN